LSYFTQLNSKNLRDGVALDDHADSGDEATYGALHLPGARRGDDGSRRSKIEVLTHQVAFSSTGREWAAVSGEGLHVYSLDDEMIFDPISLTEEVTPSTVVDKLRSKEFSVALRMSVLLNEYSLVSQVLEDVPFASIAGVVRTIGPEQLERLMQFISKSMENSPHIEFYLEWCLQMLLCHGVYMDKHRGTFMRAFRAMNKVVQSRYDELRTMCDENTFMLDFVRAHAEIDQSPQAESMLVD